MMPGGGIAETFTNVIAPASRIHRKVAILQQRLLHPGRFAQLSSCSMHVLVTQQFRKFASALIPETHPDEMKKLMDNNQTQRARPLYKLRIHHYFALPNEAGRINRSPAVRLVTEQLAAMSGQL
jgi:hypothetical protein